MLGKTLYAKKYGISTHEAAAYVIGRRHYKLAETYNVPNDLGGAGDDRLSASVAWAF